MGSLESLVSPASAGFEAEVRLPAGLHVEDLASLGLESLSPDHSLVGGEKVGSLVEGNCGGVPEGVTLAL